MGKRWRIGEISFQTKEEYKAGQRDLKRIRQLVIGVNLDDPLEVKELYRTLRGQPFLFESEVGTEFKLYLQERSFGSTERKTLRSTYTDYDYEDEYGEIPVSRKTEKQFQESKPVKRKKAGRKKKTEGKKKTGKKKLFFAAGICAGIALMGFAFWQIFSYDIQSYISEKKMEELISCILVPYNATVSEAHRIADLIASGQYTEEEAIQIASEEGRQQSLTEDGGVLYQYSVLYERNQDMAGWIRLDGTVLNYPVMLTPEEEEYYLKRGFDKKSDINGLPFMDARCSITEPVSNYLIYGHNMKNGSMFACLFQYEDPEFYEEHKQIYFDTIYETGVYEIVGVFQTRVAYADEDSYRYYSFITAETAEEYDTYIAYVKEHALYDTGVTAEFGEQLLTLSTCDNRIEDGRFVVVAKRQQ